MAAITVRSRYTIFLAIALIVLILFFFRADISTIAHRPLGGDHPEPLDDAEPPPLEKPAPSPVYKPVTPKPSTKPIGEYFPLAAAARSKLDLPRVPEWNKPPMNHVPEKTPLFIGFTRNWPLLQQAVIGYITAGWPPEDIIVVENTGVMDANEKGKLTPENPFFLDHHRLKNIFGVQVMVTPVYHTFAQLQNVFLYEAIKNNWSYYLWSHMDVMPQSHEDREPYRSLYQGVVDAIRETQQPGFARDSQGREGRWALRFFAYDWLTMMNTAAMEELGGWDTMISYYTTDCDLYERMKMVDFSTDNVDVGRIWDMYESLPDLAVLYRAGDTRNSSNWHELQQTFQNMQNFKYDEEKHGRLDWQISQTGGEGEPYYRDPDGFAEALEIYIQAGIKVFRQKWGQGSCALRGSGLGIDDAWKVDHVENI